MIIDFDNFFGIFKYYFYLIIRVQKLPAVMPRIIKAVCLTPVMQLARVMGIIITEETKKQTGRVPAVIALQLALPTARILVHPNKHTRSRIKLQWAEPPAVVSICDTYGCLLQMQQIRNNKMMITAC